MDVELLRVKSRIRLDQNRLADHLLHLLEPLGARSLELLDHLRVDAEHYVATVEVLLHLAHLDVDVVADSDRRLDHASTDANVASGRERTLERLLDALASDSNQTEALVAIDINTGKFVGKTARLEDTIVKTNLDAIPEIVRQIRLRDLGGIIIIDFIDMDERKNRNRVMAALEDELKNDRAPSKVLQFNDFGLVAITRKRVKQSLERTLSTTCNICTGTGMVKSPVTVCNDIYIEMRKMQRHLERGDVMLRVNPEVVKQLKAPGTKWLQEMEEMVGKTILVKSDPSLHPEQFDIH